MKLFLSAGLVVLLSSCATTLTTTVGIQGQPVSLNSQPFTKDDCKNGGWQTLRTKTGESFKNQGDCVSFFAK